jgi:hypothetical protein
MKATEESGIIFEHDETTCECIKFDENVAYKKVDKMLKPTKGVDFIYIFNNKRLAFVEVKNMKGHTTDSATKEKFKDEAEDLMTAIAIKVRDSIACGMSAAKFSTNDSKFWKSFNTIFLKEDESVIVVAWIEFDGENEREKRSKMKIWGDKLKQKLHWIHSVKVSVNDIDNPAPLPLNVQYKI